MPRPDEYFSRDYAAGAEEVTSSQISEDESSSAKAAVKLKKAVKDLENDSATYETRRPYRRVIKATVRP